MPPLQQIFGHSGQQRLAILRRCSLPKLVHQKQGAACRVAQGSADLRQVALGEVTSQLSKRDLIYYLEGRHTKTDGLYSLDAGEKPISERYLSLQGRHPAAQVG